MTTSRRDALKHQIEAAFVNTPRPDDDHIGYNPEDWESAELTEAFKGKHWKELDPAELNYNSSNFLSPEGFRHYLPAYLIAALDDYGDLLPHTVYNLIPNLNPDDLSLEKPEPQDGKHERFERLSPTEKQAVRAFLEYVRDEYAYYFFQGEAPRLALERYWGQQ